MNASKESAAIVLKHIKRLIEAWQPVMGWSHLEEIEEFVKAALKRLPSEAAIVKERERKKRYRKQNIKTDHVVSFD